MSKQPEVDWELLDELDSRKLSPADVERLVPMIVAWNDSGDDGVDEDFLKERGLKWEILCRYGCSLLK